MPSVSTQSACNNRNASAPGRVLPTVRGSSWETFVRSIARRRSPFSGTSCNSPVCRVASRTSTFGTVHPCCAAGAGPTSVRAKLWSPMVRPLRCIVMTRRPSSFDSAQWLNAAPLNASTSSPSGRLKLSLNNPTRVIATFRSVASTKRSSPSDTTCLLATRTSGATDATRNDTAPPSFP